MAQQLALLSHPATSAPPVAPTLRPYQESFVNRVYREIKGGNRRIVGIAVMGAGKTVIGSHIMHDCIKRGRQAVFLVDQISLLDQTAKTLWQYGLETTILQADRPFDRDAPAIVVSLDTLKSRINRGATIAELLGNPGVIILDECHETAWDKGYGVIDEALPNTPILGLTATPWRTSKKEWLEQKFQVAVEGPQPPEIIKMGGAVPCRVFRVGGALDLETLEVRHGDYVDTQMAQQATRPEALRHTFDEWLRITGGDRPTIHIGSTVEQAKITAAYWCERGYPAEVIVGDVDRETRKGIVARLETGETKLITSVGCLSKGFDCPPISCVLFVRKTVSKALFHQCAGRGSRPYPKGGKTDYLLLDFGGNQAHGNPMGFQDYSIKERKVPELPPPVKDCPQCGEEISIFARICPCCGYEFPPGEDEEEVILPPGTLNEQFDKLTRQQLKDARAWRKQSFQEWLHPDWVFEQFDRVYGYPLPAHWLEGACLRRNHSQRSRTKYLGWLQSHRQTKVDVLDDRWYRYQLYLEFGPNRDKLESIPFWWEIFGIDRSASEETLKTAYRRAIAGVTDPSELRRFNEAFGAAQEDLAS